MATRFPCYFKFDLINKLLNLTRNKLLSARFPGILSDGATGTVSEVRQLRLKSFHGRDQRKPINDQPGLPKPSANAPNHSQASALLLSFIYGLFSVLLTPWMPRTMPLPAVSYILLAIPEPETPGIQVFWHQCCNTPDCGRPFCARIWISDNPDLCVFGCPPIAKPFNELVICYGSRKHVARRREIGKYLFSSIELETSIIIMSCRSGGYAPPFLRGPVS